jgi:hypothetical protein
MKGYIHARLTRRERETLESLKKSTGRTESELVRRGLYLVEQEIGRSPNALQVAGRSVGKFKKGPADLARNKKHLAGFGK